MGQYYTPVILNEEGGTVIGSFEPHEFDRNGSKLMEHSYFENGLVQSVVAKALMASITSGKPITLAWVGDYADLDEDIRTGYYTGQGRDYERIFLRAQRAANNRVRRLKPDDEDIAKAYKHGGSVVFYNIIRKEKLSLLLNKKAQIERRKARGISVYDDDPELFIIHPIPLLTAIGNGKGGGDYHDDGSTCMEWVGKWALHPLWVVPDGVPEPEGAWADISELALFEEGRNVY